MKEKIPERSCFYCKYGAIRCYSVECRCEESLYFDTLRKKSEHCPEFKREERKHETGR